MAIKNQKIGFKIDSIVDSNNDVESRNYKNVTQVYFIKHTGFGGEGEPNSNMAFDGKPIEQHSSRWLLECPEKTGKDFRIDGFTSEVEYIVFYDN